MVDVLKIAIVQTTLDSRVTWNQDDVDYPKMAKLEADRIWKEIESSATSIDSLSDSERPHILVMPEFGAARDRQNDLISLSDKLGAIVISGLDFRRDGLDVHNEALVAIPYNWPDKKGTAKKKHFLFGKVFPSPEERQAIDNHKVSTDCLKFKSAEAVYILDLEDYGKVGLAICADFYDLNRFLLYRGRIQHLILVAYNKDLKSFLHLAESISRIVYCNVVVCNTGYYGGSLVFTPADKEYKRYIYRHEGAKLFTMQVVEVPVESLYKAQQKINEGNNGYKSVPPGYELIGFSPRDPYTSTLKEEKVI